MASIRSHLLNHLTRVLMWWMFRKREHPAIYRQKMERIDRKRARPVPEGLSYEDVSRPFPGRWIRNKDARPGQVILYLPGGAFIMRLPEGHSALVADLCARAQTEAFMASYRLAPEHPYPAAPQDALAAYRELLNQGYAAHDIVVMGDSAGGNLAMALPHLIRSAGLTMPAGVIGLSPITDFAQISASWRLNRWRDPMYMVQSVVNPIQWYLANADLVLTEPAISPYYGDFSAFPRLYFMVGALEALVEDSVSMARKALDNGIPAKVHVWDGMPHVFLLHDVIPEAKLARQQVAEWLQELRSPPPRVSKGGLERDVVRLFGYAAFTGHVSCETNDRYRHEARASLGSGPH